MDPRRLARLLQRQGKREDARVVGSGLMSPRLSLNPRNKVELAATGRYSVRAPARKQVVENAGTGGDRRRELKILVSIPWS